MKPDLYQVLVDHFKTASRAEIAAYHNLAEYCRVGDVIHPQYNSKMKYLQDEYKAATKAADCAIFYMGGVTE